MFLTSPTRFSMVKFTQERKLSLQNCHSANSVQSVQFNQSVLQWQIEEFLYVKEILSLVIIDGKKFLYVELILSLIVIGGN